MLHATGLTPLIVAATGAHEVVARVILEYGAKVNAALVDGWTPLMAAAATGQEATVRLLLGNKADPKLTKSNGITAMMVAAKGGCVTATRPRVGHVAGPSYVLNSRAIGITHRDHVSSSSVARHISHTISHPPSSRDEMYLVAEP